MSKETDTQARLILQIRSNFSRVYLAGIPGIINDQSAFLSFICCLSAIEALGSYFFTGNNNGHRFREFVKEFFDEPLKSQEVDLWKFRNDIVHSFLTGKYSLTHFHSELHLEKSGGQTILNAEDFYASLLRASNKYFSRVENDVVLQQNLRRRVKALGDKVINIGPIQLAA